MKKYEFTDKVLHLNGKTLHRIVALRDFDRVRKGDKGGWIEKEENLSQDGECWVYGNAQVFDNARVFNNAKVKDKAQIYGNAEVGRDAEIYNNKDYIVFKNWWSSLRHFTWTRSNDKWTVGCFYGTARGAYQKGLCRQ